MFVTYRKLASGQRAPEFPERAAKDAMGQVHQSPAKSPRLWPHFYGENLSFSSLLPPFLLLKWGDEVCEETVGGQTHCQCHIDSRGSWGELLENA